MATDITASPPSLLSEHLPDWPRWRGRWIFPRCCSHCCDFSSCCIDILHSLRQTSVHFYVLFFRSLMLHVWITMSVTSVLFPFLHFIEFLLLSINLSCSSSIWLVVLSQSVYLSYLFTFLMMMIRGNIPQKLVAFKNWFSKFLSAVAKVAQL